MFVDNVKVMQGPEFVAFAPLVRFYEPNDFFGVLTDQSKDFIVPGKSGGIGPYRELGFIKCAFGRVASVTNETSGHVVQRGSRIVDDITYDSAPLTGDIFDDFDAVFLDRVLAFVAD